ncbi:MAG: hypothetical protein IKV94_02105 [Clostridia bacterium]|nr:hypothetical protein [Clostridia bacterium]
MTELSRRNRIAEKELTTEEKKYRKYKQVKPVHVISMVISLIVAVFVVIQLVHMITYTLGYDMDINRMWLYEWMLNLNN